MLGMRLSSYGSTREVGRAREKRLSGTRRRRVLFVASRVLSKLPKCIHNLIDAQLKHRPFLLEHCHFKRKLIKYRILLNHFERFDWLNAITRFDRRTDVRLSRFRCRLTPYKKRAKSCQLCSNIFYLANDSKLIFKNKKD